MDFGDKSLMILRRSTNEYIHGVNDFLDKAFERASQEKVILCPCKKCFNRNSHCRNMVQDYFICSRIHQMILSWRRIFLKKYATSNLRKRKF